MYINAWYRSAHVIMDQCFLFLQSEISSLTGQLEDLDRKQSGSEKSAKNLNEQLEELREQLKDETKAKIAGSNKNKQMADEMERLQTQLEDEEEARVAIQNKVVNLNQQVCACGSIT